MADFYAPVYRDDATGAVSLRGPTMRVRQGEVLTINLRNNLTKPAGESHAGLNGFSHVSDTNMHVHGMHSYPGVTHQYAGVLDLANYVDNDNIFPVVPGKDRQDQAELALQSYTINPVCKEHMPGMAWAHPHQHGSTTLQVPTASLLVIIEGGPEWLPDANGCREVRQLLDAAPEKVLYFQMLPFRPPADATPTTPQWAQDLDDANYQTASRLSDPPNPLPEPKGSAIDRDTVLLNGGFQPRIFMKSGEYQRWRLAWATSKRWASIGIVDKSGQPAPCEMLLVGKDAVYLMEIPRKVSHAYLAAGNRAEMLVKCKGRPGSEYVLRAQAAQESPFRCCTNPYCSRNAIVQDLGTIEIKPGKEQRSPKLKACTPARAGYTADLRDASLAAAGATDKLVKQELAFGFKDFGCLFNGENFTFPDPNPIELPLGSVVEFASAKMHAHPLHIHTNPFQLIELPEENLQPGCSYSDWFEPGDFQASHLTQCGSQHDVLMIPVVLPNASVRLRIQPGEFTGYGVTHCHSLMHEDGKMGGQKGV
ncbi:hypothetical protein COHA_002508 [Chlorella ohadii]|uniref:Plastocyanin-like domain-containing protein n=1 Tax=Chlorella ohadii TaxID=2649997 RepID=A0AAD5DTY4_9CHLO|nr:hypothetical protein COHA_002508 [Chlorella ohadii]